MSNLFQNSEEEEIKKQIDDHENLQRSSESLLSGQVKQRKTCWQKVFCCCSADLAFFTSMLIGQEWGDKSQFAAIALTAKYGLLGVIVGGCIAHILCIAIALVVAKCLHAMLSERWITLIGGILFVLFGFYELFFSIIYPSE